MKERSIILPTDGGQMPPDMETFKDSEILLDKKLRIDLDGALQILKDSTASRERAISITKLQEAIMWLGMDLKRLNEPNPYPNSYKMNTIVEPTADGLML